MEARNAAGGARAARAVSFVPMTRYRTQVLVAPAVIATVAALWASPTRAGAQAAPFPAALSDKDFWSSSPTISCRTNAAIRSSSRN